MPDGVAITEGVGTTVATDLISSQHYQRTKQTLGPDGTATADWAGRAVGTDGIGYVDHRVYRQAFTITPTISNGAAYATGDCLGGLNTIANAARSTGYGGVIQSVTIIDKTQAQRAAIDILFFKDAVTSAGDNNPVAFSDADQANSAARVCVLVGSYNTAWPGTPLNSVAYLPDTMAANYVGPKMEIPYICAATTLYMQLVVRGTPTYTSTQDIIVILNCVLD
ncbi:MAG TPA: hypothetical protein VK481_03645 [Gemmatimonadaceae bacterium]|nr:hypothetical protein [Gemmatimonadaceae bacterium]